MKNLKEELLRKHGIFESLDKTGNSGLSKSICDAMDEYLKNDLIEIKVTNLQKELSNVEFEAHVKIIEEARVIIEIMTDKLSGNIDQELQLKLDNFNKKFKTEKELLDIMEKGNKLYSKIENCEKEIAKCEKKKVTSESDQEIKFCNKRISILTTQLKEFEKELNNLISF